MNLFDQVVTIPGKTNKYSIYIYILCEGVISLLEYIKNRRVKMERKSQTQEDMDELNRRRKGKYLNEMKIISRDRNTWKR